MENKKAIITSDAHIEPSIANLAQQLERKEIEPASLDKDVLRKCAMLFKSRGYSNSDIAEILGVDDRTVHRYIQKVKTEIMLRLGPDFQQNLTAEIMNNWKARCQRLLRLSYSSDLTKYEQARAIFMWHQTEMDGIILLERLGYLSKEQGIADVKMALAPAEQLRHNLDAEMNKIFDKLTTAQEKQLVKFYETQLKIVHTRMEELIKNFGVEIEKSNKPQNGEKKE